VILKAERREGKWIHLVATGKSATIWPCAESTGTMDADLRRVCGGPLGVTLLAYYSDSRNLATNL
jgi:hypothetical protein